MSRHFTPLFPLTLAIGLAAPWAVNAQQPAPPPPAADSGWRKFADAKPAPPGELPVSQAPPQALPGTLTVPAGTWITIRVNDVISTDHNLPGDGFSATLAQPLIADGFVLARRGQALAGRVSEVLKGGRVKGTAHLGLELTELSLTDGRQVPVRTQLVSYSAGASRGRDAMAIGTTTGIGAAIGGAAAGGLGAGAGALAGAAASTIGVLASRGRSAEVYPEAALTFRLLEPVSVATDRAAAAFRPVAQQDYEPRLEARPPVRLAQPAPLYRGSGYGYPYYYSPFFYGPSYGYFNRGVYYGGGYRSHYGGRPGRRR